MEARRQMQGLKQSNVLRRERLEVKTPFPVGKLLQDGGAAANMKLPKTFNLSLKSVEAAEFFNHESDREGASSSGFINDLILQLSEFPRLFSSEDDSCLLELMACQLLLSDRVMSQIPEMAHCSRRDPVQMVLFLMEKGLLDIETSTGPMSDSETKKIKTNFFRPDESALPAKREASVLDEPVTAYLNLKRVEVVRFLYAEGKKYSNMTVFINELLLVASGFPRVLSSPGDSFLEEISACSRLLSDSIMSKIPQAAARSRRDPLQMILFLVEKGIESIDLASDLIK